MLPDPTITRLVAQVADLQRLYERLKNKETGAITPWTTWAPTVFQSAAVAATVTYARYMIVEKAALVQAYLTLTAAGSAGNRIEVRGIPTVIAPARTDQTVGIFQYLDLGTAYYVGAVQVLTSSSLRFLAHSTASTSPIGVNPNFAVASGDLILFSAQWEVA